MLVRQHKKGGFPNAVVKKGVSGEKFNKNKGFQFSPLHLKRFPPVQNPE